jgi:hypothetical protein
MFENVRRLVHGGRNFAITPPTINVVSNTREVLTFLGMRLYLKNLLNYRTIILNVVAVLVYDVQFNVCI